ncbi:hypothetical protein BJF79_12250 [Actinomadura sp. CNU-125]|uniref:hypothetical protein n=1 Tax=Actinomadura sp. CNU-125 TaxID=1904961 RepID=UPI00095DC5DC|nr:hypothetical protein [Actinomadura sp. CNU-125]OLT26465.1 hypothetical protein BJF79_12250 [Actinomadura sp. CNU-125]
MPDATPEKENLDQLSSKELYDRAMQTAKDERDVGFLWELLRAIPAAAASLGETDRAEFDLLHGLSLLEEFTHAGEGDLGDALRPFYLDYLTEHAKRA